MLIASFVVLLVVFPSKTSLKDVQDISADSLKVKGDVQKLEVDVRKRKSEQGELPVVLRKFDPNLADSIEFLSLGLSPYVVRNVLKYRAKGGRFSTPESFARIYGLTEEQFRILEPYIYISEAFVRRKPVEKNVFVPSERVAPRDSIKVFKYPQGTLVDVNLADTTELKKIPGIGRGIARAIVAYRERLGGFYSLEQLQEVKFVTPELLEWFKLGDVPLRKLNINKEGLDGLRAHPYLNFYQAKVVVEYRKKRGKITSLSQVSLYEEFTEKDLLRLTPYVCFD